MQQYIIKRLLVMIPTLFAITLIIFVILQVAPGRPGGADGGDAESTKQGGNDGYRIYKQQFHLDKPILFNTWTFHFKLPAFNPLKFDPFWWRIGLWDVEIEALLHQSFNVDRKYTLAQKNHATEALQDYGNYIVPHLARLIATSEDPKTREFAIRIFRDNAQRPLIHRYGEKLKPHEIHQNEEIEAENKRVDGLRFTGDSSPEGLQKQADKILSYYDSIRQRYEYSLVQQARIFFLDTRFARYMGNLLTLDFGISFVDKRPVLDKIWERLQFSVVLSVLSIFLAYLLALPLGIYSAVFPRSISDQLISVVLFMLYSMPTFFVGTVLLFLFSEGSDYFKIFPTGGFFSNDIAEMTTLAKIYDVGVHLFLPLVCLTYISLASLSRYARTGLMDVIHSDYIKTARAKGLPESKVILKHAVRNGLIPILTLLGSILPAVVSGSVIIEVIFNLPGIGYEGYNAVLLRDYNMVMAIQLISAVLTLIGLLVSDILYALVDPRITYN